MNPHQKNKIDISALSPDEQRLFRLYGKLPNRSDLLQNKLKERKYFDSGDYALSKAGKASDAGVTQVGREHPHPETIPHLSPTSNGNESQHGQRNSISGPSGVMGDAIRLPPGLQQMGGKSASPVKENSFMHRSISADEQDKEEEGQASTGLGGSGLGPSGLGGSRLGASGLGATSLTEEEQKAAESVSPPPAREGMPIRGGGQ